MNHVGSFVGISIANCVLPLNCAHKSHRVHIDNGLSLGHRWLGTPMGLTPVSIYTSIVCTSTTVCRWDTDNLTPMALIPMARTPIYPPPYHMKSSCLGSSAARVSFVASLSFYLLSLM